MHVRPVPWNDRAVDELRHSKMVETALSGLRDQADWQRATDQIRAVLVATAEAIDRLEDRCEALEEELDDWRERGAR
jgi:hypothetical protein